MDVSNIVLWAYAIAGFIPIVLVMILPRGIKKQETLVKVTATLAITAPFVGMFASSFFWVYFIIAAMWAWNVYVHKKEGDRLVAEAEARAKIAERRRKLGL